MMNDANQKGIYQVGGTAAVLAVLALIVTFTAFAMAGVMGGEGPERVLALVSRKSGIFMVAYVAVGLISLFDMFTVPGLYLISKAGSPSFALWAAILAIVGDILGVTAGLIQWNWLKLGAAFAAGTDPAGIIANAGLIDMLETTFSSAGFLLVGPSFLFFGFTLLKSGFSKWLGWVGIAGGILTILGLIPALALLSLAANLLYLVWYVLIGVKFLQLAK